MQSTVAGHSNTDVMMPVMSFKCAATPSSVVKECDCGAVSAACFADATVFTDFPEREDIVYYHNGCPIFNAKVMYGSAMVQMLTPKPPKTFQDYADNLFIPYEAFSVILECEQNGRCIERLFFWQPNCHS